MLDVEIDGVALLVRVDAAFGQPQPQPAVPVVPPDRCEEEVEGLRGTPRVQQGYAQVVHELVVPGTPQCVQRSLAYGWKLNNRNESTDPSNIFHYCFCYGLIIIASAEPTCIIGRIL